MTIDWFSYAARFGRDPGCIRLLWHDIRVRVLWAMRVVVVSISLGFCIGSAVHLGMHMSLFGQGEDPRLERLAERMSTLQESDRDKEQRLRKLEQLPQQVQRIEEDLGTIKASIFGLLTWAGAMGLKELLRLLQERHK